MQAAASLMVVASGARQCSIPSAEVSLWPSREGSDLLRVQRGLIVRNKGIQGNNIGLCRDNGKENANYHNIYPILESFLYYRV